MTYLKRLRLLTGVLGAAAGLAAVGNTVFGDARSGRVGGSTPAAAAQTDPSAAAAEELARTKFSGLPTVLYKTGTGTTVFAWQVRPSLPLNAPRPRDVLVMVDTSASQAGIPLARARAVLAAVAKAAGPDDRIDVWTANINDPSATRSLTRGFQPAGGDAVREASGKLADAEYGSGAVDLKAAVDRAAGQFENRAGRQQVLLYLGDGESAASPTPLNEAARVELGHKLADREVGFFAVPIGAKLNPHNLHGFASLTGGAVVRVMDDLTAVRGKEEAGAKLIAAFDTPVLRVDRTAFGPEVAEVYPTKLPPLRADRPTLVVGTLKADAPAVTAKVSGRVDGRQVAVDLAERLTDPNPAHFFLNAMLEQWRSAPSKDTPAMLPADRALAMAATQFGLFRDEFVAQGLWAVSSDRMDHAEKLFEAAAKIDPGSLDAIAGVKVVRKIKAGELPREKMRAALAGGKGGEQLRKLNQDPEEPQGGARAADPAQPAGEVPAAADPAIDRARAAQQIQEQEFRLLVDETLRRTRRLREVDPDSAYQDLKRQREVVLANDQLSAPVRRRLVGDLEAAMRDVQTQGAEIKRRLDAERERIARARLDIAEFEQQQQDERQTQARITQFKDLMQRARFEEAYQEAQVMIAERVDRGLKIPVEAVGAYRIGQSAYHLRELRELRRIRENNYLLTMLQVEKSFVPYPDEPPVHFPPARVWQELTARRNANNVNLTFGPNTPRSMLQLQDDLENKTVSIDQPLAGMKVKTLLDILREKFQVPFFVREDLFKNSDKPEINDEPFTINSPLNGVKLGSFLDVVLLNVSASYIVRPEYIEIVPMNYRLTEKQFRAFEVGDLTLAIPNSINTQALNQNLTVFGAQLQFVGQSLGAANFLGGFGGGGFGGFGGGGGQVGFQGGALGGSGIMGNQNLNQLGQQANLGVGGGIFGTTGGQLGQFGNLGGQFGIQGNDQSRVLIDLIRTVVAYREWASDTPGAIQTNADGEIDENGPIVPANQLNSLGYYPPALALVVRGSSRYHPNQSFKLKGGDAMAAAPAGDNPVRGNKQFVKGQGQPAAPPKPGKAGPRADAGKIADPDAPKLQTPTQEATALAARTGNDPAKLWNEAFDRTITDPTQVVNAAEYLFDAKEYAHAAEALKAGLRKGRTGGTVMYEALAIALQESQAAPAEVERAALSGTDLEPADPKAYLRAAKAENELGHAERAVAFCKRAADLEPNLPSPYANALVYAERSSDVKADVVHWATANLLARDWPKDGTDYHEQAKERAGKLSKKLEAAGQKADADKLQKLLTEDGQRDLVVELLWQGPADLDLTVAEPNGSVCSATHPRTTGGGVIKADILEQKDDNRSEVYTAASAFSGNYYLTVKAATGRTLDGKAKVQVTKFKGTPRQEVEYHVIDLAKPKPIRITVDDGTRTDLASVPVQEATLTRRDTTAAPVSAGPTGLSAGAGAGSANLLASPTATNTRSAMGLVNERVETRIDGVPGVLPGVRVEAIVSADRSTVVMHADPVFAGTATDIPLPKVNLLPGASE